MAGMKKRKHGTLVIKDGVKPDAEVTIDGGPDLSFLSAPGVFAALWSRARKLDIAAAALAEVEALRLVVKALEAENRRAWAMVRKLGEDG